MRYLFFGTPEFAAIILEKLIKAGFVPAAVVCNPDRPVGRKKIITAPPTKVLALKHNIPVLRPEKLELGAWNLEFKKIKNNVFDFFIVASYAKIIPQKILDIPRLGSIGVHPSFLPKYRGPSPIQAAILNGDNETGVTLFLMDEKVDHGSILAQRELKFPISNFQFSKLLPELANLGADLLIEILPKFVKGEVTPLPQDESQATYTKKFKTEDGFVDPENLSAAQNGASLEKATEIERKVRALNPEPGVWTTQDGKRTKILEAEIIDGKLKLKKIQIEGKKPADLT